MNFTESLALPESLISTVRGRSDCCLPDFKGRGIAAPPERRTSWEADPGNAE